ESNGMICSSTELGLPKLNDGIMVLDNSIGELVLGKELRDYNRLNDDIIEIGLTPNRGDCLSIYGIARELSAFYDIDLIEQDKQISYSEFSIGQLLEINCDSHINADLTYRAIDFSNFKLSLINRLRTAIIGKYENSNDIKNILTYATHTMGVILNAYTKEKAIKNGELYILDVKKDENGFDAVYGNEKLSTICVEHKEIDVSNISDFIVEA
ncbi:phenylalanine--tRNA ligase subunit beta, partial [Aliarcobacter butzleri]|nr:phenylalanine--tRNA ligase subunit beta [Aliarcobacter butzleri]